MSNLNADLYDALKEAKVSEEAARKAASSVAAQPDRLDKLERLVERHDVKLNILIALTLAIFGRLLFFPGAA